MIKTTIPTSTIDDIKNQLNIANTIFYTEHPGDSPERQPVHTVYGGAHIFKEGTAKKMGVSALNHIKAYAPNFVEFAKILELKRHDQLPLRIYGENPPKKVIWAATVIQSLGRMWIERNNPHSAWRLEWMRHH